MDEQPARLVPKLCLGMPWEGNSVPHGGRVRGWHGALPPAEEAEGTSGGWWEGEPDTPLHAKQSLAHKCVPKQSLGTRTNEYPGRWNSERACCSSAPAGAGSFFAWGSGGCARGLASPPANICCPSGTKSHGCVCTTLNHPSFPPGWVVSVWKIKCHIASVKPSSSTPCRHQPSS